MKIRPLYLIMLMLCGLKRIALVFKNIIEGNEIVTKSEVNEKFDIKFIQTLQDFYAKTMDVALVCLCENNWITDSSNTTCFCREHIRRNPLLNKLCDECHRKGELESIKNGNPVFFDCHMGLKIFASPIIINGTYVACSIGGQVFFEPPNEKYYRKLAKEFNFNEDNFIEELKKIRIMPEEKLKTTMELLFLISNSLASAAYANYQLTQFGIDYEIPRNTKLEEWFFSNYGKMKRPISSREYEVLKLLAIGKSNTEIAEELFISVHTAKAHVSSILEKFGVTDRTQAAVKAVREGLI